MLLDLIEWERTRPIRCWILFSSYILLRATLGILVVCVCVCFFLVLYHRVTLFVFSFTALIVGGCCEVLVAFGSSYTGNAYQVYTSLIVNIQGKAAIFYGIPKCSLFRTELVL